MTAPQIGQSTRRVEDHRLLTGNGRFAGDLSFDGMLHAVFVRSPEAHGEVNSIDTVAATQMPGVAAVFTAKDLDHCSIAAPAMLDVPAMSYPVLARGFVRFAGQALAMVLADHPADAADAAEAVSVEISPLPAVVDLLDALDDDLLVFSDAGTNTVIRRTVGVAADRQADFAVDLIVRSPRIDPLTMETFVAVAEPLGDGRVTLWCSSGTPLVTRDAVAGTLSIDPDRVVVRVQDVGGAFGQRGGMRPEYAAIVAAALDLGRPVRWQAARREQLVTGDHGRDLHHSMRVSASADGVIAALDIRIVANLGAYPQRGWFIPLTALQLAPGPYDIPEISVVTTGVVTNTAPTGPYRGAGRPEAGLAIEQAVAAVAAATGLRAETVRERNFIEPNVMPLTTTTGLVHDGGDYAALMNTAESMARARAQRHVAEGSERIGVGVASFVETTAGSHQAGEYARVEVRSDGILAFTGSVSSGQGHQTVWPQVVADALGAAPEDIEVVSGDTSRIAQGTGTFGSRSAPLGAVALSRSATDVRRQVLKRAAIMLEAAVEDLVIDHDGVRVAGVPGSALSLLEVAAAAEAASRPLVAEELFVSADQPLASGCYGAVVAVDDETGSVRVLEIVAVDDCGVHLNPMIVRGQVHGGAAQGLGQALFEHIVYDDSGQPLATTLMDYSIPSAMEMPNMTLAHLVTPSPFNHLGVKGIGEAGTIGVPPAIVAAVADAIGDVSSATVLGLPLRPERVWRAAGGRSL